MLDVRPERRRLSPLEIFLAQLQARLCEVSEEDRRLLVVIAGQNGAGKTTIYNERLADALAAELDAHINPDEVERAITLDLGANNHTKDEFEERAAKEASRLRQQYLDQEISFSFETVFSDPVQEKARVAIRHAKGGHNVSSDKLNNRYERVLLNFAHGARVATLAIFFDNSEDRSVDDLDTYWDIALFENGELVVKDESPPTWWHQVESIFQRLNAGAM